MKIVITGSLGNVGKTLTANLAQKGHQVIGITHQAEKQKEVENLGATAALGSLDDVEFLTSTFAGADAVFCMIPPEYSGKDSMQHYRKIGSSYAKAIKNTGVKRVVHLSSWGADLEKGTGFIAGSHNVENILNSISGIKITHLRAGYIFYNLYSYVEMIKAQNIIGTNFGGDDKILMVDPKDIAEAAAEELVKTENIDKIRYVVSEDLTANEVAGILGEAIGKPDLKWLTFADEQVKNHLIENGLPESVVINLIELGSAIHTGIMRKMYDLNPSPEKGKTKLTDFAKEFAKNFSSNSN